MRPHLDIQSHVNTSTESDVMSVRQMSNCKWIARLLETQSQTLWSIGSMKLRQSDLNI